MNKRLLFIAGIWLMLCGAASAYFHWFNASTNRITYATGGTNYLFGVKTNANVSCFVQLIYAGSNNTIDVATDSAQGTSGDDVVVMTSWIRNTFFDLPGMVDGGIYSNDVTGQFFYVRVWSSPAQSYTNGLISTSPTNRYGNSQLFTNPCPLCTAISAPDINFAGLGFSASLTMSFTDTDGDGMPDWFETQYFGGATNGDPGIDDDVDGQINYNEYVSGTDPTNDVSVFELVTIQGPTNGNVIIRWSSVADKTYTVILSTNGLVSATTLASNIVAVPPQNSYTDTVLGAESPTYGVEVK